MKMRLTSMLHSGNLVQREIEFDTLGMLSRVLVFSLLCSKVHI